ncbi:MAG TPA: DUF4159 domain-containing protein [Bryobacteraceae bacterium]|nr:DUF4159 domain-containing protein [Bryobacteraceae bacterium]
MFSRRALVLGIAFAAAGALCAFQMPFREYPGQEYNNFPLPSDYKDKAEFVFARLMYPQGPWGIFAYSYRFDWRQGRSAWTNDYPRSDRHFALALRRLTRIQVRSVEQPVSPDDGDDIYNWPFLYCAGPDQWNMSDAELAKIREYLARGGFLLGDDFWGQSDWYYFQRNMAKLLPGRPIVEIESSDPIFHSVFDLDQRYQVPGQWSLGGMPYLNGGRDPHWRAIYDDKRRITFAVLFNHDTGDSWEWADDPEYPERYSALGIRTGVNYVVYAMTH